MRKVDVIPGRDNLKASRWVAVKPSLFASRNRTKINIKGSLLHYSYNICEGPYQSTVMIKLLL